MSIKTYSIVLSSAGGQTRTVTVLSPTDAQAGDAARPLMREDESITSMKEIDTVEGATPDAGPPKSQAAELAPVTPGAASAPGPGDRG